MSGPSPAPAEDRNALLQDFRRRAGLDDLDPALLEQSLTHRSWAFEQGNVPDNERMEFLGDAIISAVCSEVLYTKSPGADEGDLSRRRSRVVSREMLGRRAEELGLGPLLLLGRGERQTGGRRRLSVLGSALEAVVAAVYLQHGYDRAAAFIRPHILDPLLEIIEEEAELGDFKSALQELSQARFGTVPVYELLEETGPDHDKRFTVQVRLGDRVLARGEGRRIKIAENEAARIAFEAVESEEGEPGEDT